MKAIRKPLVAFAVLAVVLAAGAVGLAAVADAVPSAAVSSAMPGSAPGPADSSAPALRLDREEAELGEMSATEERSAAFTISNVGRAPLEISRVRTSCMCTFAEISGDERSPLFNMEMHNDAAQRSWRMFLEPGEEAVVTLIYRPSLMPVQGSVARTVKFDTNDPQHRTAELGIHATVR